MSAGLLALLDDVSVLMRAASASLDDVAAHATKAGAKAAGIVIDDAAVTPKYVVGVSPSRELPIIWRITLGSLRNKFLILLPAALLLNAFAPWLLMPLLMVGGAFLCFEGAEKVLEATGLVHHGSGHAVAEILESSQEYERSTIAGAIRTDLILSAEIMAITLATVVETSGSLVMQAVVLAVVALVITIAVYGTVALLVKVDDIGLALSRGRSAALRGVGRALVKGMPYVLKVLSVVGTAAMLWVGGGIVLHGFESFGLAGAAHVLHDVAHAVADAVPPLGGFLTWLVEAMGAGVLGLVLGGAIVGALTLWSRMRGAETHA